MVNKKIDFEWLFCRNIHVIYDCAGDDGASLGGGLGAFVAETQEANGAEDDSEDDTAGDGTSAAVLAYQIEFAVQVDHLAVNGGGGNHAESHRALASHSARLVAVFLLHNDRRFSGNQRVALRTYNRSGDLRLHFRHVLAGLLGGKFYIDDGPFGQGLRLRIQAETYDQHH